MLIEIMDEESALALDRASADDESDAAELALAVGPGLPVADKLLIEVDVVGEYCSRTHLSELMTRRMVSKPKAAESRGWRK